MITIRSGPIMQERARRWKRRGLHIGFVPTMGALHSGHMSLVRLAREHSDFVVVSIYVNPLQFGRGEDLAQYPRDLSGDSKRLRKAGVDVLFSPDEKAFYPEHFQCHVEVERLSQGLCGASRPGHFRGVATVVAKLFNLVQPDVAVFGEKDFQQLAVIRRMTADLSFPVRILEGPIVREEDGLAMSSRNRYLEPDQRERAAAIPRALEQAQIEACRGESRRAVLVRRVTRTLVGAGLRPEYVEIRSPRTLGAVPRIGREEARLLVAAWAGKTRLIDNIVLRCNQRRYP